MVPIYIFFISRARKIAMYCMAEWGPLSFFPWIVKFSASETREYIPPLFSTGFYGKNVPKPSFLDWFGVQFLQRNWSKRGFKPQRIRGVWTNRWSGPIDGLDQ